MFSYRAVDLVSGRAIATFEAVTWSYATELDLPEGRYGVFKSQREVDDRFGESADVMPAGVGLEVKADPWGRIKHRWFVLSEAQRAHAPAGYRSHRSSGRPVVVQEGLADIHQWASRPSIQKKASYRIPVGAWVYHIIPTGRGYVVGVDMPNGYSPMLRPNGKVAARGYPAPTLQTPEAAAAAAARHYERETGRSAKDALNVLAR